MKKTLIHVPLHVLLSGLVLLAGLTSCVLPQTRSKTSGPLETVTTRIELIDKPKKVRDDYTYPFGSTRQIFSFGDYGGEWRIHPASRQYAYAGFLFQSPYDFSQTREKTVLSFRLRPLGVEEHLSVALVDGSNALPRVLVDVPLSAHRVWERSGWGLYAIHLNEFAEGSGVPLDPFEESSGLEVDWTDIQGIRIISRAGRTWDQKIIIRNLQFGPMPWAMRIREATRGSHSIPGPAATQAFP